MSLTIYQLEHSPYCIPITRALEALGVPFQTCNVSNADRREVIELTNGKYYQVPVLDHDGIIIYESAPDSLDVARYVDRTFANGRLFPKEHEGLQRIVIGHIEDQVEGVTFRLVDPPYIRGINDPIERAMIIRHKERKFGVGCLAAWEAGHTQIVGQARSLLMPYNLALQERPFLFGETPLYADFALFGIIGNLTYRNYNKIPEGLPAISQWFSCMKEWRQLSADIGPM